MALDPLRDYVLGKNLVIDRELLEAGGGAQDTRYVAPAPTEVGAFMSTKRHIFLHMQGREHIALAMFYESHCYLVRMGRLPPGEEVFEAHEFSEDRTDNAPVSIDEMMRRVRASEVR